MIAWPDADPDTATEVFWLQSLKHFADLRIPRGRPDRRTASCLREIDWDMLRFMARQEGFIGHLDVANSIGQWHRAFDFQPGTGIADCGTLRLQGDILVERGIHLPYVECWVRETRGDERAMALWLVTDTPLPIGCLIAVGDAFMYARSRASQLPRHVTLPQLVDGADSLEDAQNIFDCEISLGRIGEGRWQIQRSSLPSREGHFLTPLIDGAGKSLTVDDMTPEGAASRRNWRIAGCESNGPRPFLHWFGSDDPPDFGGVTQYGAGPDDAGGGSE